MVFTRKTPIWVQPFFTVLIVSAFCALLTGVQTENWIVIIISALVMLCIITGYVFILMSAKYYITEDHLHIKGINYGYRTDKKIAYRDILYLQRFQWNKVDFLRVVYWDIIKAKYIDIPAPSRHIANNREQKFIDSIFARVDDKEQAHIVSLKFRKELQTGVVVDINDKDCLFMDFCQRSKDILMALIQDGGRIVLLGNCERFSKDIIIEASPPKIEKADYIYCSFLYMQHLEYATIEDVLGDVIEDAAGEAVRAIDCIAENLHTLPRDTRAERSREA